MPNNNSAVRFISCSSTSYKNLQTYDENTLYFVSDAQRIYLGTKEYTKSIYVLDSQPNASTVGEDGRLYVYNGSLYMCTVSGFTYTWTRIANVNDYEGTVTSVVAGSGLTGGTITESGTIAHAVPAGAGNTSDTLNDENPDFGESFNIIGVETDEFGHVTSVNLHSVTLPSETIVSVSGTTDPQSNLDPEDTFEVVTSVTKGTGSHELSVTKKTFKLPAEYNTTYTISKGSTDGTVLVTPSEGTAYEVEVEGWDQVAKLSDISAVFQYKGSVATIDDLPTDAKTGDVYTVTAEGNQYVYAEGSGWEKFGATIDLTPYALKADYIPRVTGKENEVAKFNADGTLSSTGHTLAADVPADAEFTDTVYTHPTFTAHGEGLYKVQIDDEGHVSNATQVVKSDITDLGIPGENTDTKAKVSPNTSNTVYLAGSLSANETTDELSMNPNVYTDKDGNLTAASFVGNASSATKATQDGEGNNIVDTYETKTSAAETYATKQEAADAKLVWEVI